MTTRGYKLKVLVPNPDLVNGQNVTNIYEFKRLLEMMQTPEEEILPRIRSAVEYQKQQMIDLGFTEEEADAKIEELIAEEVDLAEPKKEEESG